MNKAICERLPKSTMQEEVWKVHQPAHEHHDWPGKSKTQQQENEERCEVGDDEPPGGALEIRESHRTGVRTRHRSSQGIRSSGPVSWWPARHSGDSPRGPGSDAPTGYA